MCDPVTTTALIVAGTGYSLYSQREAAKDSQRFAQTARDQQDKQIFQARSKEANDRMRRARVERARLRALSAEAGVSGISVQSVIDDALFQGSQDIGTITINQQNSLDESRLQHQSNLNAIPQPDYLGTAINAGLQIAGVGTDPAFRNTSTSQGGGP